MYFNFSGWNPGSNPVKENYMTWRQGRKNHINIKFSVRISRGHSWPLRPDDLGSKSFSPSAGLQENTLLGADVHDFRRGRPWPEGSGASFRRGDFAPREPEFDPEFGGMRIFEPRILGPNSGVELFGPMFSNKKSPLKNSPSRNSPPKIHIKKPWGPKAH